MHCRFVIRDFKELKLWYYNSPRDPVPRDCIPLEDACLRVVLDADLGFVEIVTNLHTYSLRPTSSFLLARWVTCLSKIISADTQSVPGFTSSTPTKDTTDNLRMEHAERGIWANQHFASSCILAYRGLEATPPTELSTGDDGDDAGIGIAWNRDEDQVTKGNDVATSNEQPESLDKEAEEESTKLSTSSKTTSVPSTTNTTDTTLNTTDSSAINNTLEHGIFDHETDSTKQKGWCLDDIGLFDGTLEADIIARLKYELDLTDEQDKSYLPNSSDTSLLPPLYPTSLYLEPPTATTVVVQANSLPVTHETPMDHLFHLL